MAPEPKFEELSMLEPDWQDVLQRAERQRRHRNHRRIATVAVAVALAVITVPALAGTGLLRSLLLGTSVSQSRLSATDVRGLAVLATRKPLSLAQLKLRGERRKALAAFGLEDLRLLAVRDGISFYVLDRTNGHQCYALGPDLPGHRFGEVSCGGPADVFPSPQQPIFDLSIVGANAPDEPMHVIQLRGIAVDNVAAVAVLGSDGRLYGKTAVTENVFVSGDLPAAADGPLLAYDSAGKAIWCSGTTAVCPAGLGHS